MPYSLRQIDSFGEISDVIRDPALKTRSKGRNGQGETEVAIVGNLLLNGPPGGPFQSRALGTCARAISRWWPRADRFAKRIRTHAVRPVGVRIAGRRFEFIEPPTRGFSVNRFHDPA